MIFAGNPVKLVGVPYVARHAIDTIKDRCKDGDGIEEFLRKMWLLREPVTPYSRGKWPIQSASDLLPVRQPAKLRSARG